jgi:transglutaminase-like putative cysteine protease
MQIPTNLSQTTVQLAQLSEGVTGIRETLALMVQIARHTRKSSYVVRNHAAQVVQGLRQKAWVDEVKTIHAWVRDNIRYVRDIRDVETLATPEKTLENRYGDCDDKALLVAAMLEAIGHPARFVAVGRKLNEYEHVLVETKMGNRWVAVETTEPVALGWYPISHPHRLVYHI